MAWSCRHDYRKPVHRHSACRGDSIGSRGRRHLVEHLTEERHRPREPLGDHAQRRLPPPTFRRVDNIGFVGWLATQRDVAPGTGVVVRGQNSVPGGIYEYWGCPAQLRNAARLVSDGLGGDR